MCLTVSAGEKKYTYHCNPFKFPLLTENTRIYAYMFYFTGVPANDCENNLLVSNVHLREQEKEEKWMEGDFKLTLWNKIRADEWTSESVHVRQVLNSAVILVASIPRCGQKSGECPGWWSGLNLCHLQVCCFRPWPSRGWFASKTKRLNKHRV